MTPMMPGSDHVDRQLDLNLDELNGVGERFLEGFTGFLNQKKREAVIALLTEELPHLKDDEHFINNVLQQLGDNVVEEKRFVFLAINPKYKK